MGKVDKSPSKTQPRPMLGFSDKKGLGVSVGAVPQLKTASCPKPSLLHLSTAHLYHSRPGGQPSSRLNFSLFSKPQYFLSLLRVVPVKCASPSILLGDSYSSFKTEPKAFAPRWGLPYSCRRG